MTCLNPSQLTDQQLLTYIDGEAAPTIHAHVALCPACRQRATQLAQEEAQLRRLLAYQAACPSPSELEQYYLGELSPAQEDAVAKHLAAACPCCQQAVAEIMAEFTAVATSMPQ